MKKGSKQCFRLLSAEKSTLSKMLINILFLIVKTLVNFVIKMHH